MTNCTSTDNVSITNEQELLAEIATAQHALLEAEQQVLEAEQQAQEAQKCASKAKNLLREKKHRLEVYNAVRLGLDRHVGEISRSDEGRLTITVQRLRCACDLILPTTEALRESLQMRGATSLLVRINLSGVQQYKETGWRDLELTVVDYEVDVNHYRSPSVDNCREYPRIAGLLEWELFNEPK